MVNYGGKELANAFRTVRGNTIQAAREIPEDKYEFSAAPGVRTVAELLRHIAFLNLLHYDFHRDKRVSTLQGYDFPSIIGRIGTEGDKLKSKDEIVAALEQTGGAFASWLESLSDDFLNESYTDHAGGNPRTRFEHLLSAKEHEMHHRGQIMLIQRILGITPHLTRQRQEQMQARASAATT